MIYCIDKFPIILITFLLFSFLVMKVNGILAGTQVRADKESTFMVSILRNREHVCGGALISLKHAITSLQCVPTLRISDYQVSAGVLKRTRHIRPVDVIKIHYPHPLDLHTKHYKYVPGNDIAILTLKTSVDCNSNRFQVLPFDDQDRLITSETNLKFYGWGATAVSRKTFSHDLRIIKFKLASKADCERAKEELSNSVNSHHFCIDHSSQIQSVNIGASFGDLGGPLVFKGFLVGILSRWSIAFSTLPEIYTKITPHRTFIKGIVQNDLIDSKKCLNRHNQTHLRDHDYAKNPSNKRPNDADHDGGESSHHTNQPGGSVDHRTDHQSNDHNTDPNLNNHHSNGQQPDRPHGDQSNGHSTNSHQGRESHSEGQQPITNRPPTPNSGQSKRPKHSRH